MLKQSSSDKIMVQENKQVNSKIKRVNYCRQEGNVVRYTWCMMDRSSLLEKDKKKITFPSRKEEEIEEKCSLQMTNDSDTVASSEYLSGLLYSLYPILYAF